jgi:hypothetical protein
MPAGTIDEKTKLKIWAIPVETGLSKTKIVIVSILNRRTNTVLFAIFIRVWWVRYSKATVKIVIRMNNNPKSMIYRLGLYLGSLRMGTPRGIHRRKPMMVKITPKENPNIITFFFGVLRSIMRPNIAPNGP